MASEYVSFMLVFAVGISMVVGITISMQDLSNSVTQTSADVALKKVLDQVKGSFTDGVNNVYQWNGVSSYQSNIQISRLLVNKFEYELYVTVSSSGSYYLVGKTVATTVNITQSISLGLNINNIIIKGSILSSQSNPYILFQKENSAISIVLGNA